MNMLTRFQRQLCGINLWAFLGATLFNDARIDQKKSLWLAFGFGIANFMSVPIFPLSRQRILTEYRFSPLAYWFIDGRGRRFLLLLSLFTMIPALLAVGFSFQLSENNPARVGVITFFMVSTP